MKKEKRKMKNEFYCTECGQVQKPIRETDRWATYNPKCQNCGGRINVRLVKEEQ